MTVEEFITLIERDTLLAGEDVVEVHLYPDHYEVKLIARDTGGRNIGAFDIRSFRYDPPTEATG